MSNQKLHWSYFCPILVLAAYCRYQVSTIVGTLTGHFRKWMGEAHTKILYEKGCSRQQEWKSCILYNHQQQFYIMWHPYLPSELSPPHPLDLFVFPQWGKLLGGMGSAKKDGKYEVKSGDEDNPLLDNASMNQKGFTQERKTAWR